MSISYLNSLTPRNVVNGFVFDGVYDEILTASQITTRITANVNTDNHYTLLIEYSNDKVNVVSFETSTVIFDYNKLLYLTPTSRYFKLTLTAISDINDLSIETIFKHAIVYKAINQISGFVFVDNMPEIQAVSGTVAVTGAFQEIQPVSGTVAVTGAYQEIQPVSGTVAVTGAYQDIQPVSGPLTDAQLRLTAVAVSIALPVDTHITAIDNTLTFQCQERATTESYFTTSVGTGGLVITFSPTTLRNFSFNTTSAVIIYIMLYDTGLAPVQADTPKFVFPIMNANNVIFNSFDHRFVNGLGLRAVTSYASGGTGNPVANTVFVNMTLSN